MVFARRAQSCRGFSLLILLFWVWIMGMGLAAVATVWHTVAVREKEDQLLWVGLQFRNAIAGYAAASPGTPQFPKRLEDLLLDPRFPTVKRHLRQIYLDPFTGEPDWGLIRAGDAIVGIYSPVHGKPLKRANFPKGLEAFADAASYADWKFAYTGGPGAVAQAPSGTSPPAAPPQTIVAASPVGSSAMPGLSNVAPQSPEQEQRKLKSCNAQLRHEQQLCVQLATDQGRGALTACQASAEQRRDYCVQDPRDGSSPPPLDVP